LCFDVLERGVYYVRPSAPRALVLGWLGFDGVRRDSLALLPPLARGLHAGEDGTLLFDSPRAATSDLLLVEGFRRP